MKRPILRAAILILAVGVSGVSPSGEQSATPQLDFSTYFGGTGRESVTAVRVDGAGNVYLGGHTRSMDLPVTRSLYAPGGGAEVGFLLKVRADRSVVYSTYLERPVVALAVDSSGNAIVGDNLPLGNRFSGSLNDVMLTKIDENGSQVLYSIRLGGSGADGVAAMEVDANDSLVIVGSTNSTNFPLVNALQVSVPADSVPGATNAFITKFDAGGRMVFSTGWGGRAQDAAAALAIDSNLDIVVAGTTSSSDFVTTPTALQRTITSAPCPSGCLRRDAFVLRLSGDGQTIRYSTLFGGTHDESVAALAVDQAGNPHIAGVTHSTDLPLRKPLQDTCDSSSLVNGCSGYLTKITADGSGLHYSTYFGSRSSYVTALGRLISGLSVDPDGNLIATGTTLGNDLPVWRAVQPMHGGGPIFKSTDDGLTWSPAGAGTAGTGTWSLESGGRPTVLYSTGLGSYFYRSTDGGASWQGHTKIGSYAIDPLTPSIVYAVRTDGVYKSTDFGARWSRLSLNDELVAQPGLSVLRVRIAPNLPSSVYVSSERRVYQSSNAGATWSPILDLDVHVAAPTVRIDDLAIDPQNGDAAYVTLSDRSVMRREGGQNWTALAQLECPISTLYFAGGQPPTIYARSCGKVFKSVDRGASWRLAGFSNQTAASLTTDPTAPGIVYVASAQNGVYRSRDGADTWERIREPLEQDVRAILVDPSMRAIYIGSTDASNAFVTQFDPSGTVAMSTYFGGIIARGAGIAIDRAGAIIIAGTSGADLTLVRPIQTSYKGGEGDAFVARILNPR